MENKEKEYLDYILKVIKDKAFDVEEYLNNTLLDSKHENIDPEELKMEFQPLQDALNSAMGTLYDRYPNRRGYMRPRNYIDYSKY